MDKVSIGVSNHHVHLTKETLEILFGKGYELTKRNDLNQYGQYACLETVILKTDKGILENVRIIGPVRNYTQVELLQTDCDGLGVNPPVRNSGDLEGSEKITIIGPKGMVNLEKGCIIANRHIHINTKDNIKYKEDQIVRVKLDSGIILDNVHIKIAPNFYYEMHINKDEAILYDLKNKDVVTILDGE